MQKTEIENLTKYLSKLFQEKNLLVVPDKKNKNLAVVTVNKKSFAKIERIEDEGEVSYDFSKTIPDQPLEELNDYFKTLFKDENMEVRRRAKGEDYFKEMMGEEKNEAGETKSDSCDIYKDKELLGVLFDNEGEGIQIFNMAILDIDLEEASLE